MRLFLWIVPSQILTHGMQTSSSLKEGHCISRQEKPGLSQRATASAGKRIKWKWQPSPWICLQEDKSASQFNSNRIQFHLGEWSPFGLYSPALMSLLFKCMQLRPHTAQLAQCPWRILNKGASHCQSHEILLPNNVLSSPKNVWRCFLKPPAKGEDRPIGFLPGMRLP